MNDTGDAVIRALERRSVDVSALRTRLVGHPGHGDDLYGTLVGGGTVTDAEFAEVLAEVFDCASVDLSTRTLNPVAAAVIPASLMKRHRLLALEVTETEVVVATTDPSDLLALDDIRAATGLAVRPVVAARDELEQAIDRLQHSATDLDGVGGDVDTGSLADVDLTTVGADEAPIVAYVHSIIERAITSRASDIHIEPGESDLRIRCRIDGVLHEVDRVPATAQAALLSRIKIMSGLDIAERRVPQNGRTTVQIGDHRVDLRAATLPTVWGEKIVLRVLDTSDVHLDLGQLGFNDGQYAAFSAAFRKPHGMVLVTGPTGSGKSTTLYATVQEVNDPGINILTVEDPVEYRLVGVNQVSVNSKAGVTFAAVLPAILRADPDVVLIGEIRDPATAALAVEAALTGHLVLSTLHTNDAPSAIPRLIEMGVEPFLIASALDCVAAQRLARRLCRWCREPFTPDESDLVTAGWPFDELPVPETLWRAAGCRSCAKTGYRGRLALLEIMPVTDEIERLIVRRASANELRDVALSQGMRRLRWDGLMKAADGQTTLSEVMRVAV